MATALAKESRSGVRTGDLMCFSYWGKVDLVRGPGNVMVEDVDHGNKFNVTGTNLIDAAYSADKYDTTKSVTKTEAAEILVGSKNVPFTVVFTKDNGEERTLRGRLIKPEPLLGRSYVEDLDLGSDDKNRRRQVDHRTISEIIVDGTKYVVKGK